MDYIFGCLFIFYLPIRYDTLGVTNYGTSVFSPMMRWSIPKFLIGVFFADIECEGFFKKIQKLKSIWKIIIYFVLFYICISVDYFEYWDKSWFRQNIGVISLFVLCMICEPL